GARIILPHARPGGIKRRKVVLRLGHAVIGAAFQRRENRGQAAVLRGFFGKRRGRGRLRRFRIRHWRRGRRHGRRRLVQGDDRRLDDRRRLGKQNGGGRRRGVIYRIPAHIFQRTRQHKGRRARFGLRRLRRGLRRGGFGFAAVRCGEGRSAREGRNDGRFVRQRVQRRELAGGKRLRRVLRQRKAQRDDAEGQRGQRRAEGEALRPHRCPCGKKQARRRHTGGQVEFSRLRVPRRARFKIGQAAREVFPHGFASFKLA